MVNVPKEGFMGEIRKNSEKYRNMVQSINIIQCEYLVRKQMYWPSTTIRLVIFYAQLPYILVRCIFCSKVMSLNYLTFDSKFFSILNSN